MTTSTVAAIESPLAHLGEQELEKLAKEFDAIHDEVFAELGHRDRQYIKAVISVQRQIIVAGRVLLLASRSRTGLVLGTACLSVAKILENMELGHNILHGQWDWMNDPEVHSSVWDWDTASSAKAWKHSHNYIHHTYTNIRGKDKDLGYEIMRIDPNQTWRPGNLGQPLYNFLLMLLFEWGVAVHDTDVEALFRGQKSRADLKDDFTSIAGKARQQIVKDYLAGRSSARGHSRWRSWRCAAASISPPGPASDDACARSPAAADSPLLQPFWTVYCQAWRAPTCGPWRPTRWPTSCATSGRTPSSSAVTFPTRPTPSAKKRSPRRPVAAGMYGSCWGRPTSRAALCSTSLAATWVTKSSTTCIPTCPAAATPRSHPRSRTSANVTNCRTTLGRSPSSSSRCTAPSFGWRSPVEGPAPSPGPTAALTGPAHRAEPVRPRGSVVACPLNTPPPDPNTSPAAWPWRPRPEAKTNRYHEAPE